MRCTQLLDGDGATEVVRVLPGVAVEEGELEVDADVEVLLDISDVEVADVAVAVEDVEPSP